MSDQAQRMFGVRLNAIYGRASVVAAITLFLIAMIPKAYEAIAFRDPWLQPFASKSPWNTPIGSEARYSDDAALVTMDLRSGSTTINSGGWSIPVYLASSTDPVRTVTGKNSGQTVQFRVNVPPSAEPDPKSDGHLVIVDPTRGTSIEMYQAVVQPNGNINANGNVVKVDLRGNGWGISGAVRAASVSAMGGLIRVNELKRLSIPHAIAFSVSGDKAKSGPVWPSSTEDSFGLNGDLWNNKYSGNVPMGTLIAIPPSVDLTLLGLTPSGLALAHALQDFGAYMVDTGGKEQVTLYAEYAAADMPQLADMKKDLSKVHQYLAVILNNTADSIGGGGTPRLPPAPPLVPPQ